MVYKPTYNWGGHPVPSGGRMNSAMCFQQERLVGLNFAYVLMKNTILCGSLVGLIAS
jgi:hypothetical protein